MDQTPELNAFTVALDVIRELELRSVPYALGGAMAFGAWAEARGTKDVDINVFVEPAELEPVFQVLEKLGARFDRARASAEATEGPKDLLDLEKLVAVQRENLNAAYVRAQMVDMMGEADERVLEWDALVAEFGHTPVA